MPTDKPASSARRASKASKSNTASESPRHKAPSLNANPQLRQHKPTFYGNYLTRGRPVSQKMHDAAVASGLTVATSDAWINIDHEVNRRKQYELHGPPATRPPFDIEGDGDALVQSSRAARLRQRFIDALQREDANRDGCVTHREFGRAVTSTVDPFVSDTTVKQLCTLIDPNHTNRMQIMEVVAKSFRALSTKPSQRQSVGAGNVLAWVDDTDDASHDAKAAARVGGSVNPRDLYGMGSTMTVAPARDTYLPGLNPTVAGRSTKNHDELSIARKPPLVRHTETPGDGRSKHIVAPPATAAGLAGSVSPRRPPTGGYHHHHASPPSSARFGTRTTQLRAQLLAETHRQEDYYAKEKRGGVLPPQFQAVAPSAGAHSPCRGLVVRSAPGV